MRIVLVLICSFALACVAAGAQKKEQENKTAPKKKQAQSAEHATAPSGGPKKAKGSQKVATPGGRGTAVRQPPSVTQKSAGGRSAEGPGAQKRKKAKGSQQMATAKGQGAGAGPQKTKGSQQIATQGGQTAGGAAGGQKAKKSKGKPFKPQHFNLASKTKPNKSVAPAVNFQQNRRIEGSQNWHGSNYQVFRNYRCEWHDRDWWTHNHSRIVFVFGGPYYWNSGYWFPAWGYDPGAYYAYDGPIYAYNNLPPDQVIANVQAALQEQGYYQGEVDGLLGPLTRDAIANYQRDNGLYTTSTIDRPTLGSLGMA
jgi:Putative peptidoglycan binding domain